MSKSIIDLKELCLKTNHKDRAVQRPSDMIDQIGGWSSGKIGEGYVDGDRDNIYALDNFMLILHHEN